MGRDSGATGRQIFIEQRPKPLIYMILGTYEIDC